MPAPTDLTWAQIDATRGDAGIAFLYFLKRSDADSTPRLMIDVGTLVGNDVFTLEKDGVIKFGVKFLEACRKAQETLNQGKPAGEKLTAFPVPTTGTPANGQVPLNYALTSKALLASATEIKGTTA